MTANTDLENAFEALFKKGKRELKKKAKKTSNRAGVISKTKNNIMKLKLQINDKNDKIALGAMERHSIRADVTTEHCCNCGQSTDRVDQLAVWSKSTLPHSDISQITARIRSTGMYDFHKDLPIHIHTKTSYIPRCASCLLKDAVNRAGDS